MEEQAIDDAALVRETLAGHQSSFQLLVERHEARVFALLRHYVKNPVELEDLAQETFLKAFKRLDSFEGQASFYTWIYRIAVNTAKKQLLSMKNDPVVLQSSLERDGFSYHHLQELQLGYFVQFVHPHRDLRCRLYRPKLSLR